MLHTLEWMGDDHRSSFYLIIAIVGYVLHVNKRAGLVLHFGILTHAYDV